MTYHHHYGTRGWEDVTLRASPDWPSKSFKARGVCVCVCVWCFYSTLDLGLVGVFLFLSHVPSLKARQGPWGFSTTREYFSLLMLRLSCYASSAFTKSLAFIFFSFSLFCTFAIMLHTLKKGGINHAISDYSVAILSWCVLLKMTALVIYIH